ncbi:hypothetical protein Rcae01_01246 [Novipirellula caenicola]|uniref:Uncharacterized protein n=1 Tax=Novipirellula caenicola TaxID=1536901 RepID=A0ABP9VKS3_9BACT
MTTKATCGRRVRCGEGQQFTIVNLQFYFFNNRSFGIAAVGVKVAGVDGAETLDEFRYEEQFRSAFQAVSGPRV